MARPIDGDKLQTDMMEMVASGLYDMEDMIDAVIEAPTISPDEVRGVGEWEDAGKQMVINLENAREHYSALGYPHRTELKRRCSLCRKITLVDASIEYRYCPHCGARMEVSG